MGQLQITSDMSWIEVQFLKNAVDTLSACRQTLKWSYALAYPLRTPSCKQANVMKILLGEIQHDGDFRTEPSRS
jgi:hypothetical protein